MTTGEGSWGSSSTGLVDWARRIVALISVFILVFALSGAAGADPDFEINIAVDTVVRAHPVGSVILLIDPPLEVPSDLVGRECTVVAQSENQSSVHPGNDLLIETGDSQVLLKDVEAVPGGTVNATETVVVGEEFSISLVMGPDRVFSAGILVRVNCALGATTTVEVSDTSTTVNDTTSTAVDDTTSTTDGEPPGETTTTADIADVEVTTTVSDDKEPAESATSSSIEDEVMDSELLPFTGAVPGQVGQVALMVLAFGALLVAAAQQEH